MAVASVDKLIKAGFSYRQAAVLQKIDDTSTTFTARTTVRAATIAGATVLPVVSVANLAIGDVIVIARSTGTAETRTITAVDATATTENVTVAALTNAHAIGEAVEESTTADVEPTLKELIRAGFTGRQAKLLVSGTSAAPPPMKDLLKQGKFTRHQAKLIRGA